jgi:uncharacterized protein (TIGR02453 family)
MNISPIINFLNQLSINNNREWFLLNKVQYEEARKIFEELITKLISEISTFDKSIQYLNYKDCIFRIYRDIRFSKNKQPYKTNFGGFIAKNGKKSGSAGYYIHIEPQASFIAGGIYMPDKEKLKAIRDEIYYNSDEFYNIINEKSFKKYFAKIDGDKLSKPPKEYDKNFQYIDLLMFKSYTISHYISDKQIISPLYLSYISKIFKSMSNFNNFLNRAIE